MGRPIKYMAVATIPLALSFSTASNAEITWNGFLSVGGGFANIDGEAEFVNDYEEEFTFNNETVLGLQLRSQISDKLSATGQLVARGNEDYEVDVAWAYLSYEASDSTTIRLGRFRTPFYLYSDFLEVGYAYHWISPPDDVYSLPADSVDGFDIVYNTTLGEIDTSVQFYGGSIDSAFEEDGQEIITRIRNQAGLALTFNHNWLTLRISHHEAQKVGFDGFDTLFGDPSDFSAANCPNPTTPQGLGAIAALDLSTGLQCLSVYSGDPSWAQSTSNLEVQDVKFSFDEIALKADWNNILAVAEFTQLKAESGPLDQQNRMFATLGYTFGDFMVHVTHANTEDDLALLSAGLDTTLLGPLAPLGEAYIGGLNQTAANFATISRTTNTLGLRWDFEAGAAFKVEYSEVDDETGITGSSGNLVRFAIDLVF